MIPLLRRRRGWGVVAQSSTTSNPSLTRRGITAFSCAMANRRLMLSALGMTVWRGFSAAFFPKRRVRVKIHVENADELMDVLPVAARHAALKTVSPSVSGGVAL
jgi:hypothetical protein